MTIALTILTFAGREMSLLFNTQSRFAIAFLPWNSRFLISLLQSPSTVISESKERKFVTASTFPPGICHEVMVAQMVKHLLALRETWVWLLGREDLLEKEMATHSSILAWRIPWMEEPGRLQFIGSERVGHDWATSLYFLSFQWGQMPWS